jgi:hypothetical protein
MKQQRKLTKFYLVGAKSVKQEKLGTKSEK